MITESATRAPQLTSLDARAGRRAGVTDLLRRDPWFAGLPAHLQLQLGERGRKLRLPDGALITAEGLVPDALVLVLEGRVALSRWLDTEREALLHVGQAGTWLGETAATGGEALVTATTRSELDALYFPRPELVDLVRAQPSACAHLSRLLLRSAQLFARIAAECRLDTEQRLRTRLASLARLASLNRPTPTEGPDGVELVLSQSDLAEIVGVSRQTANALLRRLAKEGLVELGFRRITVLDPDALALDSVMAL